MLLLSLVPPLRPFNATTDASSITPVPARSSSLMASTYACPAGTPLPRMVKLSALLVPLIMSSTRFYFRLECHHPIGSKCLPLSPISSTSCHSHARVLTSSPASGSSITSFCPMGLSSSTRLGGFFAASHNDLAWILM